METYSVLSDRLVEANLVIEEAALIIMHLHDAFVSSKLNHEQDMAIHFANNFLTRYKD